MAEDGVRENVEEKRYQVNFFKPTSAHGRSNARLVGALVLIWAVAVFGFQFLLMAMQKPTPEPAYGVFQQVWPNVSKGTASKAELQQFGRVALAVLGKNVALKEPHRKALKGALAASLVKLGGPDAAASPEKATTALGLEDKGFDLLYRSLLPSSLKEAAPQMQTDEIPAIMELYLVHNRSALTDFSFLGFPFHYWYTAQFLLILFVLLCLVYAVVIDKIHAKHNFVEE